MDKQELEKEHRSEIITAINESLKVVDLCLHTKKDTGELKTEYASPCYGYPAAILLFSIIDTIGSFVKGSNDEILIGSRGYKIKQTSQHFYILNHQMYFNLNLTMEEIKSIYGAFRSRLIHNHALPTNAFLITNLTDERPFISISKDKVITTNLIQLFNAVKEATNLFSESLLNEDNQDNLVEIENLILNHNPYPEFKIELHASGVPYHQDGPDNIKLDI